MKQKTKDKKKLLIKVNQRRIEFDHKAPLATDGKCFFCDKIVPTSFKFNRKIKCTNPKCKKPLYLTDIIIYRLLSDYKLLLDHIDILPLYGRQYINVNETKILVGILKKVILPKRFSNIREILLARNMRHIHLETHNIKPTSFEIISSGKNTDIKKEIFVAYVINYEDKRKKLPI